MITIHFFAGLRELAKLSKMSLPWVENMTVGSLRVALCTSYPKLAGLLVRSSFAINDQISSNDQSIPNNAEIAILPPVSGG